MTAIIDLGTNTFHLLIYNSVSSETLYQESLPAKIGAGGINQGIITEDGITRALVVLKHFRTIINQFEVKNVQAFGTSAIRNAKNATEFIEKIWVETQIPVKIIVGDEEAGLIYLGVKKAVNLGSATSMIVDIGGGSVEFIICNQDRIFWKQSFEIGGQRLLELFMKTDPINFRAVEQMNDFFRTSLLPLANAYHQYQPAVLVGSSGSFDTLVDMWQMKTKNQLPDNQEIAFDLPLHSFYESYEDLLFKNKQERLQIAGMIPLRIEMIVVAVCLIRWILQTFEIKQIKVSRYALKEGIRESL